MVVHTSDPSSLVAEPEEPGIQGQPGLHGETLFQKKKKEKKDG
jgi:hypothetical protein